MIYIFGIEEILNKNVIIICIDGGRLDWAKKSSIMEKFSGNSVFFSQSITYAPYTNSAIHALISGSYGNRNGCYSYWHSSRFKSQNFKTLVDYLHEKDYYTCADLISDLVLPRKNFDSYEVYDESDINLELRHTNLLESMKEKNNNGKKFFLYLHHSGIHTGIRDQVLKVFNNFSPEYFKNKPENIQRYDGLFRKAETYLEKIHEKIKDLDLFENSIILIISDHGISVGEKFGERAYGAFCYDYTIKTFTYFLANNLPILEIKQQTRTIDFMPTVLDFLEIPLDHNFASLDGISLTPLINGEETDEQIAFTETANPLESKKPPKEPNTKSVRTSKWKLIYNEHNNTKELYNLERDPNENENLIGNGLEIENILWEKLTQLITTRD